MRLDKFICKSTTLNKHAVIEHILAGDVRVNGETMTSERSQVHENNVVCLLGNVLTPRPFRYLLMHKPADTICSNIDEAYPSVLNGLDVEYSSELHIAGRLDADTTGLILVTDDGRWSFHITQPQSHCQKVYRVGLAKPISADAAARFKEGVHLQGEVEPTRPAELSIITPTEVCLGITEGKFHQVKRMFAAIGNRVVSLHRESIGSVTLDVELGHWRYLSEKEVRSLSVEHQR